MQLARRLIAILFLLGCDEVAEPAGRVSAVVHDVDDRLDVYEYPDALLAAQASASVVAVIPHTRLAWNGSSFDVVGTTDLQERLNLCADERFADQPTVAICSGTLIDDDLVLTAGHCILPQGRYGTAGCTTLRFVFDFLESSPGVLASIDGDDVYACRSVVAHHLDDEVDYAIVQLDRAVVGRTPTDVRRVDGTLSVGDRVIEIGFPTGMPMKIDDGGHVLDPGPTNLSYFVTDLDGFHGNSGSGVLDASRRVVGVAARTSEFDYIYDSDSRCYRVNVEDGSRGSFAITYADWALEDVCDTQGFPSVRLCGIAPTCGDSFCTAGETSSCPGDCPIPICGDGICESTDTAASCPYDCGATIVQSNIGGCSVVARSDHSAIALGILTIALVLSRRRRLAATLLVLGLVLPAVASAQPRIHPWGLRFVATIDAHRDRSTFWNPTSQFGTLRSFGYAGGLRIGADMGLGRWAGAELTAGAQGIARFGITTLDLALAPRFRILMRPRHELYLRAPIGAAFLVDIDGGVTRSLLTGGGVGYRWQLTRVVDAFVELEAVGRFGGAVDPYYAYSEGYGLHPSSPPHLRTATFGLRLGIGLGRGYRPRCDAN